MMSKLILSNPLTPLHSLSLSLAIYPYKHNAMFIEKGNKFRVRIGKRRHKNNLIYLKSSSMKWEKPLMNQFNRFSFPFFYFVAAEDLPLPFA